MEQLASYDKIGTLVYNMLVIEVRVHAVASEVRRITMLWHFYRHVSGSCYELSTVQPA